MTRVGLCNKTIQVHYFKWLAGEGHELRISSATTGNLSQEQIENW